MTKLCLKSSKTWYINILGGDKGFYLVVKFKIKKKKVYVYEVHG